MLKIIAGKYRSRIIEVPESGTVPTKNRVREAMLSALSFEISGAEVLDLFAGSGALGIETLSRGASHCTFCDVEPKTAALIKRNLESLKESNGTVICGDYLQAISSLNKPLDIVFLDPPYVMKDSYQKAVDALSSRGLLKAGCVIVLEYEGDIPFIKEGYSDVRERHYGLTNVLILRK